MVKQTVTQADLTSIKMFDGTKKNNYEALMKAIKNVTHISGQNTICIACSKLLGSP